MKTFVAIPLVIAIFIFANLFSGEHVVLHSVDKSFKGIERLEVSGSFLYVEINSHSGTDVALLGEVKGNKERDDIKIRYEQSGTLLKVWLERPNSLYGSHSGKLVFQVPEQLLVDVDNSSGSVKVSNISGEKELIRTSSGSIDITNLAGELKALASSGSVRINGVKGDVMAETSSGSLMIKDVKGDLNSVSSSGSQTINGVKGKINTKASSGSIHITDVKGDVSARTSSGSIQLTDASGKLSLQSSSGSQKGDQIRLTGNSTFGTSSGSITMNLENDGSELSFKLTSTSGSLNAKGTTGKRNLTTGDGNIVITGNSSSGSQRYN